MSYIQDSAEPCKRKPNSLFKNVLYWLILEIVLFEFKYCLNAWQLYTHIIMLNLLSFHYLKDLAMRCKVLRFCSMLLHCRISRPSPPTRTHCPCCLPHCAPAMKYWSSSLSWESARWLINSCELSVRQCPLYRLLSHFKDVLHMRGGWGGGGGGGGSFCWFGSTAVVLKKLLLYGILI